MGSVGYLAFLNFFLFQSSFLLQTALGNAELKILMELKASLDPENRLLSSWTEEGEPCAGYFEGVACNEHGRVTNISLQGKGLSGTVAPAIAGLKCLSGLYLHYNSLRGEIPREISNLNELFDLYLNVNDLSGAIPPEIGSMNSLQVLQLCCNQLNGSIPTQLGSLKKLSVLSLQSNQLTGAIPASLGNLMALTRLDLSFNKLFGSIPVMLADAPQLELLDVRNNSLSGKIPSALERLSTQFLYGNNSNLCGNGFPSLEACDFQNPSLNKPESMNPIFPSSDPKGIPLSADVHPLCEGPHCPESSSRKTPEVAVLLGVTAAVAGAAMTGVLLIALYHHRKRRYIRSKFKFPGRLVVSSTIQATEYGVNKTNAAPLINLEYSNGWDPLANANASLGFSGEVLQGLRFNLDEVESSTQHFSEVNLVGRSDFTAVYRGMLRDGSTVAVKSINKTRCKAEEAEFLRGLKMVACLRHENLVRLRGFCCSSGRGECFLISDFAENGNLSRYLDAGDESAFIGLPWSTRVSIINGVAKGIEYLHGNKPKKPVLVHQNICAEKILLDRTFTPLISDSGLHALLAQDAFFSMLKDSAARGYMAPEYATVGRFTDKSDVYAFGVVVLQILSGRRRVTPGLQLGAESGNLEELMDDKLKGKFSESEARMLLRVAAICTHEDPQQRPTMQVVIEELNHSGL